MPRALARKTLFFWVRGGARGEGGVSISVVENQFGSGQTLTRPIGLVPARSKKNSMGKMSILNAVCFQVGKAETWVCARTRPILTPRTAQTLKCGRFGGAR